MESRSKEKLKVLLCLAVLTVSAFAVIAMDTERSDAATSFDGGTTTIPTGITYSGPLNSYNLPAPINVTGFTIRTTFDQNSFLPTNYAWCTMYVYNQDQQQGSVIKPQAVAQFFFSPTPSVTGTYNITATPSGVFNEGSPTFTLTLIVREHQNITVTFDGNGGTGTMDPVTVSDWTAFPVPDSAFTPPAGYVFSGWKEVNPSGMYKPGQSVPFMDAENDFTLVAQWTLSTQYRVSWDLANVGGFIASQFVNIGNSLTLINVEDYITLPTDWHFAGWMEAVGGTIMPPGTSYTPSGDITLIASYDTGSATTYIVNFNANGGTGTMNPLTVNEGTSLFLPMCLFSPPVGLQFSGWTINNDGNILQQGSQITVENNIVITANWTSAGGNGGSGANPQPDYTPLIYHVAILILLAIIIIGEMLVLYRTFGVAGLVAGAVIAALLIFAFFWYFGG